MEKVYQTYTTDFFVSWSKSPSIWKIEYIDKIKQYFSSYYNAVNKIKKLM